MRTVVAWRCGFWAFCERVVEVYSSFASRTTPVFILSHSKVLTMPISQEVTSAQRVLKVAQPCIAQTFFLEVTVSWLSGKWNLGGWVAIQGVGESRTLYHQGRPQPILSDSQAHPEPILSIPPIPRAAIFPRPAPPFSTGLNSCHVHAPDVVGSKLIKVDLAGSAFLVANHVQFGECGLFVPIAFIAIRSCPTESSRPLRAIETSAAGLLLSHAGQLSCRGSQGEASAHALIVPDGETGGKPAPIQKQREGVVDQRLPRV